MFAAHKICTSSSFHHSIKKIQHQISCNNDIFHCRSNITWQSAAKLSFIENQIKVCEAISSPVELEHWYIVLGSHLAKYGTERRLRTLLDDLLGAVGLCRMYADDNTELQEKETILVNIS